MINLTQPLQELLVQLVNFIPSLIVAIVVFLLAIWGSKFLGRLVRQRAERRKVDQELCILLERLTYWTGLILGTTVALGQVNFNVTGFVAGLGIVGFTLGFALQDIARNFVAGILLLWQQPFGVGDLIQVQGFSGTVLEIAVRATTIKTPEGQQVSIPNADIYTSPITNYSIFPLRRADVTIGIGYEEDIRRAVNVFLQALLPLEGIVSEPAPAVVCSELGSSTVDMKVYFWFNQRVVGPDEARNRVVRALKEAAEREKINMPYPIQAVQLLSANQG